ncbi:hypothetical protein [Natronoglomus mannanivorans]|uniref:Uncharacterized protein n=1 Tax=Natronoglomus mannanivorans TaxID=2979990 RepID=A0AAP2YYJ4_9EURY|nr:hypothetical protein [Halobacteria archaeon AArc-xg1-1]
MIDLTDREYAIVALALAGGFVCGLWAGLFLMPAEALDVPTTETDVGNGEVSERVAFYPLPRVFVVMSILVPAAALWFARIRTRGDPEETDDAFEWGDSSDLEEVS